MVYGNVFFNSCKNNLTCDISAEDIQQLKEFFTQSIANYDFDFIKEDYEVLTEETIYFSQFAKNINNDCKQIANILLKNGLTEDSKKEINKKVDSLKGIKITELIDADFVRKVFEDKINDPDKVDAFKRAVVIFLQFAIANIIANTIISVLFPGVADIICAVICAPLFEESAKNVAVKEKCLTEFQIIFNILEFRQYVGKAERLKNLAAHLGIKVSIDRYIIKRIDCICFHCTTGIVHFLTQNEEIQKKLKLNKEEDKEKLMFIGRVVGFLMHATWNAACVFLPRKSYIDIEF